ncbi:sensor histidine kinase [Actinotalea solisilvae]|uniref:sensor histidine kinase n=1 Tax=Actinotalea solisilvae TaxID=2072922 RepID=UPI0018F12B6D|nr:HAMP domain-containing sensor histidine kinase [Actinotalea solisilvae]
MRRLLVRYGLAMTSVVLVAFLVPLGLLARSLAEDRAVSAARQEAQGVAALAGGVAGDDARLEAALLRVNAGERRTTVFRPDGSTVGAPPAASDPSDAVALAAATGSALTARAADGVEVVLPVVDAAGVSVVRTVVPDAELTAGVREAWLVLAAVGVVLLTAAALVGDRIALRLARSVSDLSAVAQRLGAGDLAARVEPSGPPEVASVGRVLNGLGARVDGLLTAERELVADLSHRLRTPITALRLDVDSLPDPDDRARLAGHVEQLVEAVDAVVWTARHPAHRGATGSCDSAVVVRERAAFWGVLAVDQGRDLEVDVTDAAPVAVAPDELGAALDVLLDNVFSHTPDGAALAVRVEAAPDAAVRVVVEDAGPGFDAAALAGRGASGAGSTGLGLDVARRTAEAAGGALAVDRGRLGGARVAMTLPGPGPGGGTVRGGGAGPR